MKSVVTISTIVLLAFLGLLHFYWAVGGRAGLAASVPQKSDGSPVFAPGPAAAAAVGVALWMASAVLLVRLACCTYFVAPRLATWSHAGCIALSSIFLVRAVGDFRFVGFFKTLRSTHFATLDTLLYTPVCVILSVGCLVASF